MLVNDWVTEIVSVTADWLVVGFPSDAWTVLVTNAVVDGTVTTTVKAVPFACPVADGTDSVIVWTVLVTNSVVDGTVTTTVKAVPVACPGADGTDSVTVWTASVSEIVVVTVTVR